MYIMSLTNFDIEEICNEYKIKLIKVCAKDELNGKPKNGGYIINLDNHDSIGSHWVAFYVRDTNATYFDSFGAVPPYEVCRFLNKGNVKSIYNTSFIQDLLSNCCGFYSIYFLYYFQHHKCKNNKAVLNQFTDQFCENDTKRNVEILKNNLKTI